MAPSSTWLHIKLPLSEDSKKIKKDHIYECNFAFMGSFLGYSVSAGLKNVYLLSFLKSNWHGRL